MMCRDLSSELNHFDLQKELELKQVLIDYATRQLERHEKVKTNLFYTSFLRNNFDVFLRLFFSFRQCQGKWFAMKFLLDTVVAPNNRAVEFSKQQMTSSSDHSATSCHDNSIPTINEGTYVSCANITYF